MSNRPAEFGTGYSSWGTRGGATLGEGNGARANIFFGNHAFNDGYGFAGVEGQYIWGLSQDMDLGVGGRLPFWPIGIAPGVEWRWRLFTSGPFQLALDASAWIPVSWYGYGSFGVSLEPGVAMSYFFRDNMELFFGGFLPVTPLFAPVVQFQMGFDARVGFAYTLKRQNIGFFANFDFAPGYYWYGTGGINIGGITVGNISTAGFGFGFNFLAGAQFRFH